MAYKNILTIGLSIVAVGLIGWMSAHIVDGLVYTLGVIMANPLHAILLSLVAIGLLFQSTSKK